MFFFMSNKLVQLTERQRAMFARVRLVRRVGGLVHGQVAHLRELFVTYVAFVRRVAGVDANVCAQVALLSERLAAHGTLVRFFARVHALVVHQVADVPEPLAARRALFVVWLQVLRQELFGRELACTLCALELRECDRVWRILQLVAVLVVFG